MSLPELPPALTRWLVVGEEVALKVMLDLTVYLEGPTIRDFEFLFDLYESLCPPDRLREFKIAELPLWSRIADPILTMQGREAAAAGIRRPFFQPVRTRIRQGRGFEAQLWDGLGIEELQGSWSLNCRRIHLRERGMFAFARLLVPLDTDPQVLVLTASAIGNNVPLRSGHGGLAFVYEPLLQEEAFDAIYSRARRFWGVDIESMNDTLPLTADRIKGVNWITLVGRRFAKLPGIASGLGALAETPGIAVMAQREAALVIAGAQPVAGDRNRPDMTVSPYAAVARALAPLMLEDHPDFPGERFPENGNTVGWIRRFLEPEGWA